MSADYFHRVAKQTPTRIWVNNPTRDETRLAIAAGAISATTNPSYCSRLLRRDPDFIRPFILGAGSESHDVHAGADWVYQQVSKPLMQAFLPQYAASGGARGFVTMQDDPNRDEDPRSIIEAASRHQKVGPNYMAKIPAIEAGLEAMEYLIGQNVPVCATECFALSQAIAVCALYERKSNESGCFPPFFLAHITGIFDEEIQARAVTEGIDIEPALMVQAGCIVARRIYGFVKEKGYRVTLLGGGARHTRHFTEFVGGDFHVTLNWDTMKELLDADAPVESRIDAQAQKEVVGELERKLPLFAQAYREDGLRPAQFKGFAPLQRFRNSFLKGWDDLCRAIEGRGESETSGG